MQREGQNTFHHRNLPIKWARIVGAVVAIDDFYGRRVYTIDDSSGVCIECNVSVKIVRPTGAANTYSLAPPKMEFEVPECEAVDVGHIVDIKGLLSTFREEMTIQIQKINALRATEEEVVLWERRIVFERDVLGQPWVLTAKQIDRCRRTAEQDADKEKRREEKARRQEREKHAGQDPSVELDGYGRPKKQRRARPRRPDQEQTHGEPDFQELPLTVELDGYGRPKKPKGPRPRGPPLATERREEPKESSSKASSRLVLDDGMRGKYSALGL